MTIGHRRLSRRSAAVTIGLVWVILLALFLMFLSAGQSQRQRGSRDPARLLIVTALLPPHMDEGGEGREARIIREVFRAADPAVQVEFFVLPFSRHWASFLSHSRFHAVTTVPTSEQPIVRIEGYESRPYITYRNGIGYRCDQFGGSAGAVTLSALAGHPVAGFAGAAGILPELADAAPSFSSYREWRNQRNQTARLLEGEVDAVIADGAIVRHYVELFQAARRADGAPSPATGFSPVFPATTYHMVFRSQEWRDLFDRGLSLVETRLHSIDGEYYPAPANGACE